MIDSKGHRFRYDPDTRVFQEWDDSTGQWVTHRRLKPEPERKPPQVKLTGSNPFRTFGEEMNYGTYG